MLVKGRGGCEGRGKWPSPLIPSLVLRPQAVIELGRKIRERATKPVKFPLRKLVVVHPSQEFLDDVQGEFPPYACDESQILDPLPSVSNIEISLAGRWRGRWGTPPACWMMRTRHSAGRGGAPHSRVAGRSGQSHGLGSRTPRSSGPGTLAV